MLGEFLRELAVLIFVFVPLELWTQSNHGQFVRILIWTAVLAIASLAAGIVIERVRP
jgi:hypothetical protein